MCSCQQGIGRKKNRKMANKKKATRRRRRSGVHGANSSDIQGLATAAFIGGAGAIVLKKVLDAVLPADYTQYTSYAQIAAGVLVGSMSKNPMLQGAALGASTVGAYNVVQDLVDGQTATNGLGLLAPGNQTYGIRARPEYRIAGNDEKIVMQ